MNTPNGDIDYVATYGLDKEVRSDRTTADLLGVLEIADRCAKDRQLALQYMKQNFEISLKNYMNYKDEGFGLCYESMPPFLDLKRKRYNLGDAVSLEDLIEDDPASENFETVGKYLKHLLENYPAPDIMFGRATQQRNGVGYRFSQEEILDLLN